MAEITIRISNRVLTFIGLFIGTIFLVWLSSNLWSSGVFIPKYKLSMYVPRAVGVAAGALVRIDGIDVGKVSDIRLVSSSTDLDRRIELILVVQKRYQSLIRSDSRASFVTEGLLGGRYVNISRGLSGNEIAPGGELPAVKEIELPASKFPEIIEKLTSCIEAQKNSTENKKRDSPK